MRDRLLKKFDRLERMKAELLIRIDGVDADRLQRAPQPGKWSAAQVMDHLCGAEGRSVEYIRKKTLDPKSVPPASIMCAVRTILLTTALSSPLRFKAPDVVADVPDNPPVDEVTARWKVVRAELRELIETLPEDLLGRALFRHAVAGRMNMSQTLDFMIFHLKRHSGQIDRAIA